MAREPLDKNKVIAAAAELADREGLDAVTLTRIAEDLGVRQPAMYRHVKGYDDLIRSLGLLGREILAERLADAAIGVSGEEAVAAVAHAWRRMVQIPPRPLCRNRQVPMRRRPRTGTSRRKGRHHHRPSPRGVQSLGARSHACRP